MRGWLVEYSVAGRHTRKFFSDLAFGSSARAQAAAEEFAIKDLGQHHEITSLRRRLLPRKNTPHGMPGIARYVRPGGTSGFWIAHWTQDGTRHSRKYSVARYGERGARELAFSTRADMIAGKLERLAELLEIHAPSGPAQLSKPTIRAANTDRQIGRERDRKGIQKSSAHSS
jgi:hypothetical protein